MSDLVQINISKDVIAQLGDQFSPIFSQIRIYGTLKKPLFVAKDVEKVLGLGDLHLRDKPDYKEGFHFIMKILPSKGGVQKTIVLTETGLNKAMHNSNMPLAEQYCSFITVVMSELRCEGIVTMEKALFNLKQENIELKAANKILDEETERQHYMLGVSEDNESYYRLKVHQDSRKVFELLEEVDTVNMRERRNGNAEYVALLERAVMKTVYIYLMDNEISDQEADDLPENIDYQLKLSQKANLARGRKIGEIMMVNPVKQIVTLGAEHEISLTDLRSQVTDSNLNILKTM